MLVLKKCVIVCGCCYCCCCWCLHIKKPSRSLYPVLPLSVLIQQTLPIPVVTESARSLPSVRKKYKVGHLLYAKTPRKQTMSKYQKMEYYCNEAYHTSRARRPLDHPSIQQEREQREMRDGSGYMLSHLVQEADHLRAGLVDAADHGCALGSHLGQQLHHS